MKTFKLENEKPRSLRFDVYYGNQKLKNNKQYDFQSNSVITLVEKNIMLSKLWWLYFLIDFIGSIGGASGDFKEIRRMRKTVVLLCGNIIADNLCIIIGKNAKSFIVDGVDHFSVENEIEEDCSVFVNKRIKKYKKIVIILMLSILFIIFGAIAIDLLIK